MVRIIRGSYSMCDYKLNLVQFAELRREIGGKGVSKLIKSACWLQLEGESLVNWESKCRESNIDKWFAPSHRFATSLVCEGEIKLFGQSMPRFAIRLAPLDGGFINVRRLGTLAGQLLQDQSMNIHSSILKTVLNAPCTADAFLRLPRRFKPPWRVLTAPPNVAYGETEPNCSDDSLTPYVRHMRPGGGMCAQAACFMASAISTKLHHPLHSLPDITLYATKKQNPSDKIEFEGLWTDEIPEYFRNCPKSSLGAIWQAAKLQFRNIDDSVLSTPTSDIALEFRDALRTYVLSGVPIIVPVDVGRMEGIGNGSTILYPQKKLDGTSVELELVDPLNTSERSHSIGT